MDLAALAVAGPDELETLLANADRTSFTPARDPVPLRGRLVELEREHGVTPAHRLATERIRAHGTSLGLAFRTNAVGESTEPRAEAQVTNGVFRPPAWALHPDGRSACVSVSTKAEQGVCTHARRRCATTRFSGWSTRPTCRTSTS